MTLHYFNKRQKTDDGNTLRGGDDQDLVSSALRILHLFASMTRRYTERFLQCEPVTPNMVYNGHAITDKHSPSYRLHKRGLRDPYKGILRDKLV